ncbi:MAG TPA: AmmeMemoRadiSam system protein A [Bacteroidota bacterium]|nr:AmmeMemoRadiSam system protein A [Bacteroidota bacterium]
MLSDSEKQILFDIARRSIESAVQRSREKLPAKIPPALMERYGAFVTLRIHGELRGCIGYIDGINPLCETVYDVAAKAAMEDYRFEPLTADEMTNLEIEISILSPRREIHDFHEIEIGTHGLIAELGNRRGLLLPQVAPEQGWDQETFVKQTVKKAGLPSTMWQHPDIRLFVFTAEILQQDMPANHTH